MLGKLIFLTTYYYYPKKYYFRKRKLFLRYYNSVLRLMGHRIYIHYPHIYIHYTSFNMLNDIILHAIWPTWSSRQLQLSAAGGGSLCVILSFFLLLT